MIRHQRESNLSSEPTDFPPVQEPGLRGAAESKLVPLAASTLLQRLQACPDRASNALVRAENAGLNRLLSNVTQKLDTCFIN